MTVSCTRNGNALQALYFSCFNSLISIEMSLPTRNCFYSSTVDSSILNQAKHFLGWNTKAWVEIKITPNMFESEMPLKCTVHVKSPAPNKRHLHFFRHLRVVWFGHASVSWEHAQVSFLLCILEGRGWKDIEPHYLHWIRENLPRACRQQPS